MSDIDAPLGPGAASGRLGANVGGLPGATWSPAFIVVCPICDAPAPDRGGDHPASRALAASYSAWS